MTVPVPADFPRTATVGAVPGAQPKLLVRKEAGRFTPVMLSESDIQARHELCEDLVQQLLRYSARKQSERPGWTPAQVHARVAASVRQKAFGWGLSPAEAEWVLRRWAALDSDTPSAGSATS